MDHSEFGSSDVLVSLCHLIGGMHKIMRYDFPSRESAQGLHGSETALL